MRAGLWCLWAMATSTRMTAAEYIALPPDDGWRELIDGVVVVNEPRPRHGIVFVALSYALKTWINEAPGRGFVLPPTDVDIDEANVFAPDILWVSTLPSADERLPRIPDLCVEIRSPSTWRYDVGTKLVHYQAAGLPELWLVDTVAESVIVQRRSRPGAPGFDVALELSGDERLTSPQLPGFAVRVADIFSDIP
jgi:Uma2 family endonuclease